MNELDFTHRLEASLKRGMASVPLPALEPARARYRMAALKEGRRQVSRLIVVIAVFGVALFGGVLGAAASGTSPATAVSTVVHRVGVLFEHVPTPVEPVVGSPSHESGLAPAVGSQPPTAGQNPGDVDRAAQSSETTAPIATTEPAPTLSEEPAPSTADAPPAGQPEDATPSLSMDTADGSTPIE